MVKLACGDNNSKALLLSYENEAKDFYAATPMARPTPKPNLCISAFINMAADLYHRLRHGVSTGIAMGYALRPNWSDDAYKLRQS